MKRKAQLMLLFLILPFIKGSLFNWRYKKYIISKNVKNNYKDSISGTVQCSEGYINQTLDHFDPLVKGSLQQKYYVVNDFWKKPDGPVFLFIGGEGALSTYFLTDGLITEIAETHGALILGVEHRYYGESLNVDSLKLNNLQYLSSQQALADLAEFHRVISDKYSLGPNNTWICFGGSYAGDLSAWFRVKYPHLVYAAVASSAPVRAVTNFEAYNDVVKTSLSDTTVGGSQQCLSNISSAFKEIQLYLDNNSLDKLHKDFKLCSPLKSANDYAAFLSNLADPIEGAVQYNTNGTSNSIGYICKLISDAQGSPYERAIKLNDDFLMATGADCLESSYLDMVQMINDTNVNKTASGVGERSWTYQTCTQFGFFQTCDNNTQCPFSSYMGLGLYLDMCRDVFGISPNQVNASVNFTNLYYGSDTPKGTRIIFINGY
ncbi:thymus-specific serine protease-like [Anneissia japonica]|uniref:thymus-specific serine protease-like n=1 Tax=Anneissia japonica TaxID=1529436 RepID=UPI001425B9F4|nr:thymus-specific serine protease-like [Anneissia japonica]